MIQFKSKYFAIGWDTTILSSDDGFEWSVVQDDPKNPFKDKIRSPQGYFAIDYYGEIYVSKDDLKWNKLSVKSDWYIEKLFYKDNKIFAFGEVLHDDGSYNDVLVYSEDGVKWNNVDSVSYPSKDELGRMRMCNEYFLLPVQGSIYKSKDGILWDKLDYKLEYGTICGECFDSRNYIFITNLGVILETPDLVNFKVLHEADEKFRGFKKIIWDGNKYLILKYCYFSTYDVIKIGIMYSDNLTVWNELILDYNYDTEDLFVTKAGYYIIGDEFALFSTDGVEWVRKYYRYKKLKHLE